MNSGGVGDYLFVLAHLLEFRFVLRIDDAPLAVLPDDRLLARTGTICEEFA